MQDNDPIIISGTRALIARVPVLLGITPTESVVTICLSGSTIKLTMRVDIPTTAENADQVVREMVRFAARSGADSLVLLTYTDDLARAYLVSDRLAQLAADPSTPKVLTRLWISGGVVGDYSSTNRHEQQIPAAPTRGELLGRYAPAPRADVAAALRRTDIPALPERNAETDRIDPALAALIDQYGTGPIDAVTIAQWCRAIEDVQHRDQILADIVADHDPRIIEALSAAATGVPIRYRAAAYTLTGIASYILENSTLVASIWIDYALEADPDYMLAKLMHISIANGVSGHELAKMLTP